MVLNHFLSIGVRVLDSKEVSENFHSRFDAKMKTYKYILNLDEVISDCLLGRFAGLPGSPGASRPLAGRRTGRRGRSTGL